jgi:hypothetical protein
LTYQSLLDNGLANESAGSGAVQGEDTTGHDGLSNDSLSSHYD